MSDPTDPIDQAAQSVAKHAHDVMFQGIVNGLFGGGSDAALLQAVLDELRELNRAQRRAMELLERWDAYGAPSVRHLDDDPPDPTESASGDPRTPPVPGPAAAEPPSADSRPPASSDDPETKDRPE